MDRYGERDIWLPGREIWNVCNHNQVNENEIDLKLKCLIPETHICDMVRYKMFNFNNEF